MTSRNGSKRTVCVVKPWFGASVSVELLRAREEQRKRDESQQTQDAVGPRDLNKATPFFAGDPHAGLSIREPRLGGNF